MRQPNVLATETGAVRELAQLLADPIYLGAGVPRGDGRPVVVLPGLFANDLYLQPTRLWLRRIGYRPVRSTLALNVGCPQRLCLQVGDALQREMARRPGPVALIGHSRGGILARAIAARLHDDASHLIVLGSPVGAILRMPGMECGTVRLRAHSTAGVDGGQHADTPPDRPGLRCARLRMSVPGRPGATTQCSDRGGVDLQPRRSDRFSTSLSHRRRAQRRGWRHAQRTRTQPQRSIG